MSTTTETGFLGHPKGLMTLFFSEMWERTCYYGMRVLLMLYLVKSLMKGDADAAILYGAYTGLVYAAPVLGGLLADKFLGYRYSILLGATLMAIGEFLILGGTENYLLIGMGALIIGNGYFKANISTIVGKLYKDNDPRRDSGFTIFYIGINIGALLATTVIAYVGETYGFEKGFGLAGIGMLLGLFIFWAFRDSYSASEGLEITEKGHKKFGPIKVYQAITIGSIIAIPAIYLLMSHNEVIQYLFLGLFIIVVYSLIKAGISEGTIWRDRMIALSIFMVINIVFWASFEQAGTSLTLYADRNVDRWIFDWQMPAANTQFFNPFFIIVFGSLFSIMWVKLSKIGKNPNIPLKFAFGLFQLGLGFLVTLIAFDFAEGFKVPLLTLVFLYMLHTSAELFISPIGLSMVTKLSPKSIAGTAMGGWFLSFAIANFLAGQIATFTAADKEENENENIAYLDTKLTVKDALNSVSEFDNWKPLVKGQSININLDTYYNWRDFLQFRNASSDMPFETWQAERLLNPKFKKGEELSWLDTERWNQMRMQIAGFAKKDSTLLAENKFAEVNDFESWLYFRSALTALDDTDKPILQLTGLGLGVAYQKAKMDTQEKGLIKYTDIFSLIGYTLIVFSILIALLRKPLNSLMHGVE